MATPTTCYPWWHAKFIKYRAQPITIHSGCHVNAIGNIACEPEAMRADAERRLHEGGYLRSLSLETYSLARYMQTEVGGGHGGGTIEEAVAVGEAAVNRARLEGKRDANAILLYRQNPSHPNYGYYGPIHGTGDTTTAPYGRWASSHAEPTVLALLLADLVTSGKSGNFSRGADDQAGLQYTANFPSIPGAITAWANRHLFWVGPLPGVNHWRTFLVKQASGESANTAWGAKQVQTTIDHLTADMAANDGARKMARPWPADMPTCPRGGLLIAASIVGATIGALMYHHRRS